MNIKIWTCFCLIQGIYKNFDADQSGVIGSDELPGAFNAAGEYCYQYWNGCSLLCVAVCVFFFNIVEKY